MNTQSQRLNRTVPGQLSIYDQGCIGSGRIFAHCGDCACGVFNCLYSTSGRCAGKCDKQKCGGGSLYPTVPCERYVKYTDQTIKECLKANVQIFQDGYIVCCLTENYGCEKCYKEFEEKEARRNVEKASSVIQA